MSKSNSSVTFLHPKKCLCTTTKLKPKKSKRNRTKKHQEILQEVPLLIKPHNHHCQLEAKCSKASFLPHDSQSLLLCIAALCFSKIRPASTWSEKTISRTLLKSAERLRRQLFMNGRVLVPALENIPGHIRVGKCFMQIRIFGYVSEGIIRKNVKKPELLSLDQGLKQLFANKSNSKYLLRCNKKTSAVWEENGKFYLFQLFPSCSNEKPTVSLQKHFSVTSLVKTFIKRHFSKKNHDSIWLVHAFETKRVYFQENKTKKIRNKEKITMEAFKEGSPRPRNTVNINININKKSPAKNQTWSKILSTGVETGTQCDCNHQQDTVKDIRSYLCDYNDDLVVNFDESVSTVDLNMLSPLTSTIIKNHDQDTGSANYPVISEILEVDNNLPLVPYEFTQQLAFKQNLPIHIGDYIANQIFNKNSLIHTKNMVASDNTIVASDGTLIYNKISTTNSNPDGVTTKKSSTALLSDHRSMVERILESIIEGSSTNADVLDQKQQRFSDPRSKDKLQAQSSDGEGTASNINLVFKDPYDLSQIKNSMSDIGSTSESVNSIGTYNIINGKSFTTSQSDSRSMAKRILESIIDTSSTNGDVLDPKHQRSLVAPSTDKQIKTDGDKGSSFRMNVVSKDKNYKARSLNMDNVDSTNITSKQNSIFLANPSTASQQKQQTKKNISSPDQHLQQSLQNPANDDNHQVDFSESSLSTYSTQLGLNLGLLDRKASDEAVALHAQVAKFWLG